MWLNPRAGKMRQILRSEQARWTKKERGPAILTDPLVNNAYIQDYGNQFQVLRLLKKTFGVTIQMKPLVEESATGYD